MLFTGSIGAALATSALSGDKFEKIFGISMLLLTIVVNTFLFMALFHLVDTNFDPKDYIGQTMQEEIEDPFYEGPIDTIKILAVKDGYILIEKDNEIRDSMTIDRFNYLYDDYEVVE
jgi:hypothetical protein